MKDKILILCMVFCCFGCSRRQEIELNDKTLRITDFERTDSLVFTGLSDEVIEEPSEMAVHGDYLVMNNFNRVGDGFVTLYSLASDSVVRTLIPKGAGPDEMNSCSICILGNNLWLYDMGKSRIGCLPMSAVLEDTIHPIQYPLSRYYYDTAMLNDTVMVGTNDVSVDKKLSFVHLKSGEIAYSGDYAYWNAKKIPVAALVDACNCYVDVNPRTRAIALSYRYTDVLEIYDCHGKLEYAVQGPDCFDIRFRPGPTGMSKTKETRKAFVNTYVTPEHIYLLYSGCTKEEENWSNGSELFVYSWTGTPERRYILSQPIYTFAVDESRGCVFSFSLATSELIKACL